LKKIVIVGLGPGSFEDMSLRTWKELSEADRVFLRTARHPLAEELRQKGVDFVSFDEIYESKNTFAEVYERIVQSLFEEARACEDECKLVYAVPGNPLVGENTVKLILARSAAENIEIIVYPAMSFLDAVFVSLGIDPAEGIEIVDALEIDKIDLSSHRNMLFLQVHNRLVAADLKLLLLEEYPPECKVTLIKAAGIKDMEYLKEVRLCEMDHLDEYDHLTSVYFEPQCSDMKNIKKECLYPLDPLVKIMEKLRSPEGCPWDREQDHDSLKPCLIEETYEVIEAIDSGDKTELLEELGDLLLQVVFHTILAEERGDFDHNDVIGVVVDKMIRRHPHVFGDAAVKNAQDVIRNWEIIKANERQTTSKSGKQSSEVMKKLNRSLPALLLAEEVQKKARKVGFDWEDAQGARDKLIEEINELLECSTTDQINEEIGDVLFSIVNLARFFDLSAEQALRDSTEKFLTRFNYMEEEIANTNKIWSDLTLVELEELWNKAKTAIIMQK